MCAQFTGKSAQVIELTSVIQFQQLFLKYGKNVVKKEFWRSSLDVGRFPIEDELRKIVELTTGDSYQNVIGYLESLQ